MKKTMALVICVLLAFPCFLACTQEAPAVEAESAQPAAPVVTTAEKQETDAASAEDLVGGEAEAAAEKKDLRDAKADLTIWLLSDRADFFDMVVKEFNKAYPNVTVTPGYFTSGDLTKNLSVAAASGGLPSIWYGGFVTNVYNMWNAGYAADLTSIAKRDGWFESMLPGILEMAVKDDKVITYPTSYSVFTVLYRKDIFAKVGLEIPSTMDEFYAVCEALKAAGYIPMAMGGTGNHYIRFWDAFVEMYAGSALREQIVNFEVDWTQTEAVKKGFEEFKAWYDKGYIEDNYLTLGPNDARLLMYTGQAAMTYDTFSIFPAINKDFDISQYDFFYLPRDGGGERMATTFASYQFNNGMTEDELELAVEFINYLCDDREAFINDKIFPVPRYGSTLPAWTVDQYDTMMELVEAHGTMRNYDVAMPGEVVTALKDELAAVTLGTVSVDEAIANVWSIISSLA